MSRSPPGGSTQGSNTEQPVSQARSKSVRAPQYVPAAVRPFKRPRLKLACQICRDRKIRCDGARPVCDSCSRKHHNAAPCIYPGFEAEQAESYAAPQEKRDREFESRPRIEPSEQVQPSASYCLPAAGRSSGHREQKSYNQDSRSDPRKDSRTEVTTSFLGASSAVGFMKEVSGVFRAHGHDATTISHDTPSSSDTLLPATSVWFDDRSADDEQTIQEFFLPPKRTADELLHLYFNVVHPEMPVFYKPSFLERYGLLWTAGSLPSDSQDRTLGTEKSVSTSDLLFHCMLSIVFALGHVVQSLKLRTCSTSAQQIFIKIVNRTLTLDLIGKPSLQLVHTLILLARYYQHQGLSNRNWITVGMLIRIAQGLGLHVDMPGESQAQREERRRTWCACTTLDSIQSMTFGRPAMLSSQSIPKLPGVIDDQYLCTDPQGSEGVQPEGTRSELAFFIHALKLSQISGRTLRTFFDASTGSKAGDHSFDLFGTVLELDALLQSYCNELPVYLWPNQPQTFETDRFFARQASWLQIRVLQIRLTMFREVVVRLASKTLSRNHASLTSFQRHIMMGCIDASVSTSREIIDLVHDNVLKNHRPDFVPPPWYTTLLMYTAGTVLVVVLRAAPLRQMLSSEIQRQIHSSWSTCIQSLEHYQRSGIAVAVKCIATLHKIYEDGNFERQQSSDQASHRHHSISNQSPGEHQQWDSNDAEMPEFWWASGDMEWLDNLVEFGQPLGQEDGFNT
ncbi:fungal-specific transcription factor domain-containing protein [Cadophora sp. MPI-SDFR-AT-0126]|nr:fungal-specific transcription factor domain-containing protein [Leotiomycetes sp. MPI-SDFR-AT-0126]